MRGGIWYDWTPGLLSPKARPRCYPRNRRSSVEGATSPVWVVSLLQPHVLMRFFTKTVKTVYVALLADLMEFLKFSTLVVMASAVPIYWTAGCYQLVACVARL